jgi:hypothetical protein
MRDWHLGDIFMPRTRNASRQDDILRDEAKAMFGRTPAQGWLKPERVDLKIRSVTLRNVRKPLSYTAADYLRIASNVQDAETDESANAPTYRAELEFVLHPPWSRFPPQANCVRPNPDILERFLRLAAASDRQIHRFASSFGALSIFPRNEERKMREGKLVIVESCEMWRYFAVSMRSLLRIASCFHADRKSDPTDWDQIGAHPKLSMPALEKFRDPLRSSSLGGEEAWIVLAHFVRKGSDRDRKMWALLLNALLELGRVRPWMLWEGVGSSVQPNLVFSGPNLLSHLALQLCLRASKHDAFAVCSYCSRQYSPLVRAPKTGQKNFCPDCRANGVPVRLAQRSRRERLRAGA